MSSTVLLLLVIMAIAMGFFAGVIVGVDKERHRVELEYTAMEEELSAMPDVGLVLPTVKVFPVIEDDFLVASPKEIMDSYSEWKTDDENVSHGCENLAEIPGGRRIVKLLSVRIKELNAINQVTQQCIAVLKSNVDYVEALLTEFVDQEGLTDEEKGYGIFLETEKGYFEEKIENLTRFQNTIKDVAEGLFRYS